MCTWLIERSHLAYFFIQSHILTQTAQSMTVAFYGDNNTCVRAQRQLSLSHSDHLICPAINQQTSHTLSPADIVNPGATAPHMPPIEWSVRAMRMINPQFDWRTSTAARRRGSTARDRITRTNCGAHTHARNFAPECTRTREFTHTQTHTHVRDSLEFNVQQQTEHTQALVCDARNCQVLEFNLDVIHIAPPGAHDDEHVCASVCVSQTNTFD